MPDFFRKAQVPFVPSGKRKALTAVFGVVWLGTILAGTFLLIAYANSPGKAGLPPAHWPDASRVARDLQLPTLVMFMHPHCPCSRASVGELALLMAHCQNRVKATVLFLQPTEMTSGWVMTETWEEAARIPGVTVQRDEAGYEARLFHIETSGDSVLYDAKGELLFHGGITISRGHAGDNPGRDSLQALLLGRTTSVSNTPAFGCSLFECPATRKP